jgi:hypothetical protein
MEALDAKLEWGQFVETLIFNSNRCSPSPHQGQALETRLDPVLDHVSGVLSVLPDERNQSTKLKALIAYARRQAPT